MIVFRLSVAKYARNLSGEGAEKSGGRWNSKGVAMVYTSNSRALCTTEIAVHTPLGIVPYNYCMVSIQITDNQEVLNLDLTSLPVSWKFLENQNYTRNIGDNFIQENKYLLMKVPSAVIQGEFNYLINPKHPDFSKCFILETENFLFDQRLFIR